MKPCRQFQNDISLLAAGVLEENVRAPVSAHLEQCSACRDLLRALSVVCRDLDLATQQMPPLEPSSHFQRRLNARIREEARLDNPDRWAGWFAWALSQRWRLALPAAAALVLCVFLVLPSLSWHPLSHAPNSEANASQSTNTAPAQNLTQDWLAYRLAANQSSDALEALLARDAAVPSPGSIRITAGMRAMDWLTE